MHSSYNSERVLCLREIVTAVIIVGKVLPLGMCSPSGKWKTKYDDWYVPFLFLVVVLEESFQVQICLLKLINISTANFKKPYMVAGTENKSI